MLRIAIQSRGRMNQESLELLDSVGVKLSVRETNPIFVRSSNFPAEVLFLEKDRIPEFVAQGMSAEVLSEYSYKKDMPVVTVYSSGTTGASKGIVLTNDGINATISHYLSPDFPYNRTDTYLQMIHDNGLITGILFNSFIFIGKFMVII